jgi:conflict system pore-forming effector with SLATT domain
MLVSGLLAALSTVLSNRVTGWAAALFFSVGSGVAVWTYLVRPERLWYEGRAIAESVKTLSWQYAVGGGRFPRKAGEPGLDEGFVTALRELLETVDFALLPKGGPNITEMMRAVRAADLDTRKATYRDQRIEEQRSWYERWASWNAWRSELWRVAMIALQLIGVVVAIVAIFETSKIVIGLLGFLATAAATAVAWHQTRDHETLAEAYSIAAHELSLVKERVSVPQSDAEWAEFVREAEQAISREHTLWRARRSRPIALLSRDPRFENDT